MAMAAAAASKPRGSSQPAGTVDKDPKKAKPYDKKPSRVGMAIAHPQSF